MSTPLEAPGSVVTLLFGFRTDITLGILITLFGFVGALSAVYFADPRRMPSMGGTEQAAALEVDRDWVRRTWRASFNRPGMHASASTELPDCPDCTGFDKFYQRVEVSLREETRNLRRRAYLLYPVLGAFISATFAVNLLQAFLLGMLWPTALGASRLARQINQIKQDAGAALAENNQEQIDRLADLQATMAGHEDMVRSLQQLAFAVSRLSGPNAPPERVDLTS